MRVYIWLAPLYLVVIMTTWFAGEKTGKDKAYAEHARAESQAIEQLLQRSQQQLADAAQASQHLLEQMQQQVARDQQTTQELRHVLAQTTDNRTDCSIPADVMQYIYQAHAAAAEATTRRLDAAVPGTGAAGE